MCNIKYFNIKKMRGQPINIGLKIEMRKQGELIQKENRTTKKNWMEY